ncbi:hypothetical protein C8R45DRAFT_1149116 [Mycena sanguinolenta]|nr:hypothetical protein C8R45DRAFT_1149116 [Mycena sanguinolenta]
MCDREGSAVNYKRSCAGQIAGVITFFHPAHRALQPTGTGVMVLTSGQYEIFKAVSKRFLEEEKLVSRRERERGSDAKADKVGIKIVVVTSRRYRIYTKIVYEILEIWEEVMATGIIQIREDGPGIPQRRLRSILQQSLGSLKQERRWPLSSALIEARRMLSMDGIYDEER